MVSDSKLKEVNLAGCNGLTTLGPLGRCTTLESADVSACSPKTPRDALAALARCPKLRKLAASSWASGPNLAPLMSLRRLRTLGLRNCRALTDADLEPLTQYLALAELDLRDCTALTYAAVHHLKNCRALEKLALPSKLGPACNVRRATGRATVSAA